MDASLYRKETRLSIASAFRRLARCEHFVVAVWRAKGQNPLTVTPRKTIIAILATLSASLALAEDFKTVSGKEYKDATVSRVEPDGIVLKSKSGISKVYFVELPTEVQQRFHYDAAK